MDETNLIKNNKDFIRKMQEEDPDFFRHLQQGQHPEFFVLACSDSRVSPSAISQMKLGNMFIHVILLIRFPTTMIVFQQVSTML